ncbi:MAG: metallophosphoesterase family protein [Hyphomonadaceae bacterium]
MTDLTYYAIGDVHGELEKLDRLLGFIRDDADSAGLERRIVFLGDLIDRGAESRAVVARAMDLQAAGEAFVVKGNHEELMLHAIAKTESIGVYFWAENGGDETIASYKRANGDHDDWRNAIDKDHIAWMRQLPVTLHDEKRGLVFVHGGIDPRCFPACSDELRMWTRSEKFYKTHLWPDRDETRDILVVHGHTPTDDFRPESVPRRINVDTGACFGGPLTCAVLAPNQRPRFLRA